LCFVGKHYAWLRYTVTYKASTLVLNQVSVLKEHLKNTKNFDTQNNHFTSYFV
jgi:hypothetical protein